MFVTAAIGAVVGAVVGAVKAVKSGNNVLTSAAKGAVVGGLIGLGVGAVAGVALAGSITATTGAVIAGGSTLVATVSAGGISAGVSYISNNVSTALISAGTQAPATASKNASQASLKPTEKVSEIIRNDILELQRTGSALKPDAYHAFNNIVDNYAGFATVTPISNGTLYQLQGALNGVSGRFEWIVQDGFVTHRLFVAGGGINGIPIMP